MARYQTAFDICSEETGEFIVTLLFDTIVVNSSILKIIDEFCGNKYYVAFMYRKLVE